MTELRDQHAGAREMLESSSITARRAAVAQFIELPAALALLGASERDPYYLPTRT